MDPVIKKYRKNYKKMRSLETFFSKEIFLETLKKKFKLSPLLQFFMMLITQENLSVTYRYFGSHGIWILEQSYFPHLIKNNAYDSICHEHLTYFTIKQIKMILKI